MTSESKDLSKRQQVLKEFQILYGKDKSSHFIIRIGRICDVNIIVSRIWIVSFVTIDAATKCLDCAKFDRFSLKINVSKPTGPYMTTGYLFQYDNPPLYSTDFPKRPMSLIRANPSDLKIKSHYFGISCFLSYIILFELLKNRHLKRRYQKIYLRQKGSKLV